MPRSLGETLRQARADRNLSLRQVQAEADIHNAHLSQIERGLIERPELSVLFELARLYELDYADLLELAGYVGERAPNKRAVTTAALRAVGELTPRQQTETFQFINQLRRQPRGGELELSEESRRRLAAVADRALREAGVLDQTPTPLRIVGEAAGVAKVVDHRDPPPQIEAEKPRWWKRVLGAVLFRERVVYIDKNQGDSRARFTEAHEISHILLPWHEQVLRMDDERNLFFQTRDEIEAEANWTAAQLLFQGHRYHERALSDEVSIASPIALAGDYEASIHASIRYYVQHHPDPVAVLVAGRYTQFDGTLPIWNSFESPSFNLQFGALVQHIPQKSFAPDSEGGVLGRLIDEAFRTTNPPRDKIALSDLGGRQHRFLAETFFNQYSVFMMVSPAKRTRTGKRVRIEKGATG